MPLHRYTLADKHVNNVIYFKSYVTFKMVSDCTFMLYNLISQMKNLNQ